MYAVARPSGKKSWQTGRERVSVEAALAIQRENVSARLVRLREEAGHPEKPGEPLPQDQAAAKAGVTVRQWQRWENGASIPYARNLSAVADAFGFDVAEFYDGPAGQKPADTPDPFVNTGTALDGALAEFAQAIRKQNELLERQSAILERIEAAIDREDLAATRGARLLDDAAEQIAAILPAAPQARARAPKAPAKSRSPRD